MGLLVGTGGEVGKVERALVFALGLRSDCRWGSGKGGSLHLVLHL